MFNRLKRKERKWREYIGTERKDGFVPIDEVAFGDLKVSYMSYGSGWRREFVAVIHRRGKSASGEIRWWRGLNRQNLTDLDAVLPQIYERLEGFGPDRK